MDQYLTVFVFGLLIWIPHTECNKAELPQIHELLTDFEIRNVFRSTRDAIPKYEVVSMKHSLHNRSAQTGFRLQYKAFATDVDIYLNPNDGILVGENTPVWIAEQLSHGMHYERLKTGIMKEVLGIYQSIPGRAALVVRDREDERMTFDGTVEDMIVTPVPSRFQNMLINSGSDHTMRNTENHIVFKPNENIKQTSTTQDSNKSTVDSREGVLKESEPRRWILDNEDIVFPTILVTTDFNVPTKSPNYSEYYDQIIYQLAFWNGVDLRYRHLSKPRVRLRIAGFVIGLNRAATPYFKNNMLGKDIDALKAIESMRVHWNHNDVKQYISPLGFHIIATVTNLKLIGKEKSGIETRYEGLARIGSLCTWSNDKFYASLVFNDDRNFGGVYAATHELAHIMGAGHDGETDECKEEDGYIMAPIISKTPNNIKWSKCSLKKLSMILRLKNCVAEPIDAYPPGKPLSKILPGTLKTADEQCRARGFDAACEITPGICRTLRCLNSRFMAFFTTFGSCQESWSAAEGTKCAAGRVCLDGECRHLYPPEPKRKSWNQLKKSLIPNDFERGSARVFVPERRRFEADIE